MNILTCIFSYNRPDLLANCAKSVDEFFPWGDRLILDDGSDHPRIQEVFSVYRKRPSWDVIQFERDEARKKNKRLGGFYRNMRHALEHALKKNYDYCFLLEEDNQFVWSFEDYEAYLDGFFHKAKDAIQIGPFFLERFLSFSLLEYVEDLNAFRSERGFNTTGIINLKRVREVGEFQFVDGTNSEYSSSYLPANSRIWLERGYRFYWQSRPTVMRNLWLDHLPIRARQKRIDAALNLVLGDDRFLISPLDAGQVASLKRTPPGVFAIREFFPNGLANGTLMSWQYKEDWNRYLRHYSRLFDSFKSGRDGGPTRIRRVADLNASSLEPSASHLRWKPIPSTVGPAPYTIALRYLPDPVKSAGKRLVNSLPIAVIRNPMAFINVLRMHFVFWRELRSYRELTSAERKTDDHLRRRSLEDTAS